MKNLFTKVAVATGLASLFATSASAAIDLTAVNAQIGAGMTEVEGFVPVILGFIIVVVIAGVFFKLVKRAG